MKSWPQCLSLLTIGMFVSFAIAVTASAAPPDPTNSDTDPCIVINPDGFFCYNATIRDIGNAELPGVTVTLDFCNCTEVVFCTALPSDGYLVNGCVVSAVTDANGQVSICIRGGGVCENGGIEVRANGVLMRTVSSVASPDQDGDLLVTDPEDTDIFYDKFFFDPTNLTADFNCDLFVDGADLTIQQGLLGSSCDGPTPTSEGTWGRVKSFYR